MVFQSYALWPHMTVAENVAYGLRVRKVGGAEQARRVDEALRMVQMEAHARRKPAELSGGQQQRVALARALVIQPTVLLLDEPLSNLDAKLRQETRAEIRRICTGAGLTAVYVTHDQKEALSMGDRVAVLRGGRVMQVGPPRELYERPAGRFVADFLGETNFLAGSIAGCDRESTVVETVVGPLTSTLEGAPRPPGTRVTCSIRPEAIRAFREGDRHNVFAAKHLRTIYLGEMAQHVFQVEAGGVIESLELNPPPPAPPGQPVRLHVDPRNVVILADES
jgi:iron(III) transport system ATP-binding protein